MRGGRLGEKAGLEGGVWLFNAVGSLSATLIAFTTVWSPQEELKSTTKRVSFSETESVAIPGREPGRNGSRSLSLGELSRAKKELKRQLAALSFARQLACKGGVLPSWMLDGQRALAKELVDVDTALRRRAAAIVVQPTLEEMNLGELSRAKKSLRQQIAALSFTRQLVCKGGVQPSWARELERSLAAHGAEVGAALRRRGSAIVVQATLEEMNIGELSRMKKALVTEVRSSTFARNLACKGVQPSWAREAQRALSLKFAEVDAALARRGVRLDVGEGEEARSCCSDDDWEEIVLYKPRALSICSGLPIPPPPSGPGYSPAKSSPTGVDAFLDEGRWPHSKTFMPTIVEPAAPSNAV